MLTMRLQRRGRKNTPSFRVVLVEKKRAAKTGNFNEVLGNLEPRSGRVELNTERIKYWLSQGVTVSDTLHNLFVSNKIIDAKKINVLPRKSPPVKENEEVAAESAPAEVAVEAAPAEAEAPVAEAKGDNEVAA